MFGPILKKYMNVHDPHAYELFSMSMIIVLSLIFGIQPGLITDIMGTAANSGHGACNDPDPDGGDLKWTFHTTHPSGEKRYSRSWQC